MFDHGRLTLGQPAVCGPEDEDLTDEERERIREQVEEDYPIRRPQ